MEKHSPRIENLNNPGAETRTKSEIHHDEKEVVERGNVAGVKSLLVFLQNTESKGTEFQKAALTDALGLEKD